MRRAVDMGGACPRGWTWVWVPQWCPVRGASTREHLARSAPCFTGPKLGFVTTEQRKKPCSTPNDPLVPLGFP